MTIIINTNFLKLFKKKLLLCKNNILCIIKFILKIIFFFLIVYANTYATDYFFNGYGISKLETIEISNTYKFSSYNSEGMWDDSEGDYGNEKCSGYIKEINKKVELEVYCETTNQNGDKFWNSRVRLSDKGGGVGQMTILSATGKYKRFIGLVCPYGVNYKEKYAWFNAKCKIKK